jgi:hypothetical protein
VKTFSKVKLTLFSLFAGALLLPDSVLACAACYGQSDSPLAKAMNWGIFTLMGVILCVLGGITMFFVHVGRKSATPPSAEPHELPETKS